MCGGFWGRRKEQVVRMGMNREAAQALAEHLNELSPDFTQHFYPHHQNEPLSDRLQRLKSINKIYNNSFYGTQSLGVMPTSGNCFFTRRAFVEEFSKVLTASVYPTPRDS